MRDRILSAITEELKTSAAGIPFAVVHKIKVGGILTLELLPQNLRSSLDETMEDGRLGWVGEASGSADIISVLPDLSVVNAFMTSGRPPLEGQIVFINPVRYLEPLKKVWEQSDFAEKAERWYYNLANNYFQPDLVPNDTDFPKLRPRQRDAFQLLGWNIGFLWGPPGTGKTTTLGSLLAAALRHRPTDRILLISTTNIAVDLAILSVDNAIGELFNISAKPAYMRFGSHFDPNRYRNRDYLIPVRDKQLIQDYEALLQNVPDPAEAEKYLAWKNRLDGVRQTIREQNRQYLRSVRLAAMTATFAASQFTDLAGLPPYDVVVFDEASQVGKAHAMTLATLGKRVLFAGDPKQLSPIVQSKSENAASWLGQSAFGWKGRESLTQSSCFLDEQWRMASPISDAVSTLFYDSLLRVAEPALQNPNWVSSRVACQTKLLSPSNLTLVELGVRARPALKFLGYCCPESAELIAALVVDLRTSCPDQEVMVLTPYRAQRDEIRKQLRSINAPANWVSTVHRAQGSEKRIVIFDPVCPSSEFVAGEEGQRLMNVAMSRAECRLIVLLQSDWVNNSTLLKLFRMSAPVRLDTASVGSLLNEKLKREEPRGLPAPVIVPPSSQPAPSSIPVSQRFEDQLLSGLRAVPNTLAHRRGFCQDLASKSEFHRKLTYSEIEACLSRVTELLPPLDRQGTKSSPRRGH